MKHKERQRESIDRRSPLFFLCGHVFASLLVVIFVTLYAISVYQLDWWAHYFFRGTLSLQDRCQASIVGDDDPTAPASFPSEKLRAIRVPHPDLHLAGEVAPEAKYLHALYRCTVTAADREAFQSQSGELAYLHLGWVFAQDTIVRVNGEERASFKGADKPIIPLTMKDLGSKEMVIDIVASSSRQARFGVVGAQPMTIAFGSAVNARIFGIETALQTVRSLHDLLPLLTFALILAFGWYCGVRVRLMVTAFFFFLAAALRSLMTFFSDFWPWDIMLSYYFSGPFRMATGISFIIFGMELLSIWPKTIYRAMIATVTSVTLILLAIALVDDPHALYKPLNRIYEAAVTLAAGAFVIVGWRRVRVQAQSSGRRVNVAFLCFCALFMMANGVELVQDMMDVTTLQLSHHFNVLLPLFLGGVLLFTLALMEQSLRVEREARQELSERLTLGRAVQNLLLPKEMQSRFANFEYQCFYAPAEQMSGDWLFHCQVGPSEMRLVMGDVVGKGPQAALAVSALLSTLAECRNAAISMQETIIRTNRNLLDMFSGHITSTLSAICLHADGRVEIYTCGSPPWLQVSASNVQTFALRSSLLGSDRSLLIGHKTLTASAQDIFLSFTDGVCDGSRAQRGLQNELGKTHDEQGTLPLSKFYDLANYAGKDHVLPDDKSMIVVRRSAVAPPKDVVGLVSAPGRVSHG